MGSPVSDDRLVNAQNCTQESVREGLKSAAIACILSAVPTFAAVRTIPWAKANLNYTGQALIISGASIASYFILLTKPSYKRQRKMHDTREKIKVGSRYILFISPSDLWVGQLHHQCSNILDMWS